MKIVPITPVIASRNDSSTKSEKRIVQKEHAENSTIVHLSTNKSTNRVPKMTKERVLEYIKLFGDL